MLPPDDWDSSFDLLLSLFDSQGLVNGATDDHVNWQYQLHRQLPSAADSVVIITGNFPDLNGRRMLRPYLDEGGRVLIATDQPVTVSGYFRIGNDFLTSRHVNDDRHQWMGHSDCLAIEPLATDSPLTKDVRKIVTNRSLWVQPFTRSRQLRWSQLALIPESAAPQASRGKPLLAVAQAGSSSAGRLVVLADDSMLTNGMLWHGDNQIFVINLVRELSAGGRRKFVMIHGDRLVRSRVPWLLAAEREVMQDSRNAVPPVSIPPDALPPEALLDLPAEALLDIGNAILTDVEDSDVINKLAANRPRRMQPRNYRRAILFALCAAALAIFLYRSWRGSHAQLPWARSRFLPPPQRATESVPMLQAAAALSRDLCRTLTESDEPTDWQKQLVPDADVWHKLMNMSAQPQQTRAALQHVLARATETNSKNLTRAGFEAFGAQVHHLKELIPLHRRAATVSSVS